MSCPNHLTPMHKATCPTCNPKATEAPASNLRCSELSSYAHDWLVNLRRESGGYPAEVLRHINAQAAEIEKLQRALSGLVYQATDACGVMSEFVAMPVKSLSDKFPTTVTRLKRKIDAGRAAIATAGKSPDETSGHHVPTAVRQLREIEDYWHDKEMVRRICQRAASIIENRSAEETNGEVERLTLEFRLASQQAEQLRDDRDRLRAENAQLLADRDRLREVNQAALSKAETRMMDAVREHGSRMTNDEILAHVVATPKTTNAQPSIEELRQLVHDWWSYIGNTGGMLVERSQAALGIRQPRPLTLEEINREMTGSEHAVDCAVMHYRATPPPTCNCAAHSRPLECAVCVGYVDGLPETASGQCMFEGYASDGLYRCTLLSGHELGHSAFGIPLTVGGECVCDRTSGHCPVHGS